MPTVDLSVRLLRDHAQRPQSLFYDSAALGRMYSKAEVALLDQTYVELAANGLMEQSGAFVSFFGDPKRLYRITDAGIGRVTASAG